MSFVRISCPLYSYNLSFDHAVCMTSLFCRLFFCFYDRVINSTIDLLVDWGICHCAVIGICYLLLRDHQM